MSLSLYSLILHFISGGMDGVRFRARVTCPDMFVVKQMAKRDKIQKHMAPFYGPTAVL